MLTPLDIESKEFATSAVGYNKSDVNQFLKEVLTGYEKIYKENIELRDKINVLNDGIKYYKTIEETLQSTLLLAEKVAEETKQTAQKKAESIESEARLSANRILDEARQDVFKINHAREMMVNAYHKNKIQIKQFLNAQLEMINLNEIKIEDYSQDMEDTLTDLKSVAEAINKTEQQEQIGESREPEETEEMAETAEISADATELKQ